MSHKMRCKVEKKEDTILLFSLLIELFIDDKNSRFL